MSGANKKYYLNVVIIFWCLASFSSEKLKPLDPTRDIYQLKEGYPSTITTWPIPGGAVKRRLPDPITIAELKKQLEMQNLRHEQDMDERDRERNVKQKDWENFWGGVLKIAGWVLVALGVACHAATTFPLIKNWASSIITLGAAGVLGGLAIQKTVQADKYLTVAFWLLIAFLIMYKARGWSISHIEFIKTAKGKVLQKFNDYKIPNPKQKPGPQAKIQKDG